MKGKDAVTTKQNNELVVAERKHVDQSLQRITHRDTNARRGKACFTSRQWPVCRPSQDTGRGGGLWSPAGRDAAGKADLFPMSVVSGEGWSLQSSTCPSARRDE